MSDVNNSSNNTVISGSNGADLITNAGSNVTINGSAGGDQISLTGSKQLLDYTKVGIRNVADTVTGFDTDSSIRAFDGYALLHDFTVQDNNVIIENVASYVNDAVTLKNAAGKTLNILFGNELERVLVTSAAAKQKITGTTGTDRVVNFSPNATVNAKNFAVDNLGASVLVVGSSSSDKVNNVGAQPTIRTGDGNDVIANTASKALLEAGVGNDVIYSNGSNVTINADKGDDSIEVDRGSDYIAPINYYPTLAGGIEVAASVAALGDEQIAALINQTIASINEKYLTSRTALDVNASDLSSIGSDEYNKLLTLISSDKKSAFVNEYASAAALTDYLHARQVSSLTSSAAEEIVSIENVIINAGDGNDVIYSSASSVTIDGSGGNDTVRSSGNDVTITGGAGNDYIRISDDNITFVPINYYPTLAADIETAASIAALSDSQLTTRINQFVASLNDNYLQNRANADGQTVTRTNTELISDVGLAANYGLSNASNADIKAAIEDNVANLEELIGNQELIKLELSNGSIIPTDKITVSDLRAEDVANGENSLAMYYRMSFARPDGTSGAITSDYGTVDTDTSLGSARSVLSSLITDINTKIRSIALTPVDTDTNPLDTTKIYLDSTATDAGASTVLTALRNIQFATDGSDLYEKYQKFVELSAYDIYDAKIYVSDGSSAGTWLTASVSSILMSSWANLRQPIDVYNFIKAKAYYLEQDDQSDLSSSKRDELANAIDAADSKTKANYENYFGTARALYDHLQAKAYRSTFATDGSDLLVIGSDGYNDLLDLVADSDRSKFVNAYNDAAVLIDEMHERMLETVSGSDTVPASNVKIQVDAGDSNDSIEVVFNDGKLVGDADNVVKFATIIGGRGNDTVNFVSGTNRLYKYTTGDGNDVIYGANSTDLIQIDGAFVTSTVNNDLLVKVGAGTITLKDAAASGVSVLGYTSDGVILFSGMEYNEKRPKVLVIQDPFSGSVDAGSISDKINVIDATLSSQPVVLKAGAQPTAINAGTGESTLIGGVKDDKLYGGKGDNTFVYTVGQGKDGIFYYEAKDIVSLEGADAEEITFTDKNSILTLTFDGDKNSKLTINKFKGGDPVTFDLGGETIVYGSLPSGVEFDDDNKKTAIKVGSSAADGVVVNSADIASTAKTLNGRAASGAVNLIGNANPNVLYAGDHGSTLYGGQTEKAYSDKMYGGAGADVFVYAAGDGADVIYSLNGGQGDYVLLKGDFDPSKVNVSATRLVFTVGKQKLTLENYDGEVRIVDENGNELYKTGINLPEGITYADSKKTMLTVGKSSELEENATIDAGEISALIKEVKVTDYENPIAIVGNALANVLRAGNYGSTLYGGKGIGSKPSADKLYGSTVDAADVFVYAAGDGADIIYNFDGNQGDYVVIEGGTSDSVNADTVKWNGAKLIATLNKQKLTLDNPQNVVRFVNEKGEELYRTGVEFPKGIGYNTSKTTVTVGSSASDIGAIDLRTDYASTVKEVNAKDYSGAINIIGNAQSNVLRAGSGGSTLDGGYFSDSKGNVKATADKLHGGNGADVFVWDASLGGADQIFGYDTSNDTISITGAASDLVLDNTFFKVSGTKAVLSLGSNKLTINDLSDGHQLNIAYGDGKTFGFASLPGGVGYSNNYKTMTIGGAFAGTFNLDDYDYMSSVVTISAAESENAVELVGNKKTKAFVGGAGQTTMVGSTINDNFYAGSGADVIVHSVGGGKDIVYNFDSSTDVIKIVGNTAPITAANFTEKNNDIILSLKTCSITLKDAPRGVLTVEYDGGSLGYKTLPLNTTYVAKTGALTLTKFFDADGLDANDLDVTVKELNASAVASKAVDLQASSENTRMTLGKGGGTLRGGSGNDTMIGNTGVDVFVAGVGADTIDKFTFKDDKIVIVSEMKDSTLKGSKDVEITTADGKVYIKNVLNQEFTIVNNGVEQKYKFTRDAKTLEDALVSSATDESAAELASEAEDYWFMKSDASADELSEISAPIAACVLDEPKALACPSFDASRLLTFNRKK